MCLLLVAERFLTKETVQIAGYELPVRNEGRTQTRTTENNQEESNSEIYRHNGPVHAGGGETDDVLDRSVFIQDVPAEMCDFLEVVIENRNKGGGAVEMFEPDPARGGVLVRFVDQQGVCLLASCIY